MTSMSSAISSLSDSTTCSAGLDAQPWDFDALPGYGPGASQADPVPATAPRQSVLPEDLRRASLEALRGRILAARAALGERLLILGHFYQRDEVVEHADFVGDSFQLAKATAQRPQAEYIVFCGVHFMAETADILSRPDQQVVLPHLGAGCSMADMADEAAVGRAWTQLQAVLGTATAADGRSPLIPVTYMNSSAALKAFCGRHGGIVCTSSNARQVLDWALARGRRVLFFPDQHLGRNTGVAMGLDPARMPVWDPHQPLGGNTRQALAQAELILWKGYCSVHQRFSVAQIQAARARYPHAQVIVHPECSREVVAAADASGSTDFIRRAIEQAPAGTTFAVGTEINFVNRLARQHPEHRIFCLDPVVCPCSTMYRIHPAYLAWVLEGLVEGQVHNRIQVAPALADEARIALERMLGAHA